MERRGFLKTLSAAFAAVGIVKATPAESAPVESASGAYGFKLAYKRPADAFVDYTGKHDIIVSPAQKKALDALRGQYPQLKSVTYDAAPPLTRRDIDRLWEKYK